MHRIHHLLACALLAASLAACSKVTVENYNRLEPGMPYATVQQILGKPTRCSDVLTVRSCTWGDDRRNITVNFVVDQVVLFTSENIR